MNKNRFFLRTKFHKKKFHWGNFLGGEGNFLGTIFLGGNFARSNFLGGIFPGTYKQKPWVISRLAHSVDKKNNIHKQVCSSQDITKKIALQKKLKLYRNHVLQYRAYSKKHILKNFLMKVKETQKRYGKLLMQSMIIKTHKKSVK